MSLSRRQPNPNTNQPQGVPESERYYIGRHKAHTEITIMSELHWTEQLRLKPKDTRVREPYDTGDFDTRIDMEQE